VPAAGEHSDFVLRSIIGLPDADIGRLAASAVVKLPDTGAE
jgi:hypothetical protein